MTMQSKVIAGERVVYSPGAVMGFEFLEHVAEEESHRTVQADSCRGLQTYTTSPAQSAPVYGNVRIRKQWTAPKIQVLDLNKAQGQHPGPLCDKRGSLSGNRCTRGQ